MNIPAPLFIPRTLCLSRAEYLSITRIARGLCPFFTESRARLFRQMRDRFFPFRGRSGFLDVCFRSRSLLLAGHILGLQFDCLWFKIRLFSRDSAIKG
jgi:hypothetical protein